MLLILAIVLLTHLFFLVVSTGIFFIVDPSIELRSKVDLFQVLLLREDSKITYQTVCQKNNGEIK